MQRNGREAAGGGGPAPVDYESGVAQTRRPRASTLEKRRKILDAVERIMLDDGYAAVTSRRVEAEAGVKPHYHFGSVDDLFVAIVQRHGRTAVAALAEARSIQAHAVCDLQPGRRVRSAARDGSRRW